MIRFSLRQLSYFVAAAEDGSTLRAAETLHVSQPAVSMAISQLEQTFQQKPFVRRYAQGLTSTPFGRRKLTEIRHLLADAAAIVAPEGEGKPRRRARDRRGEMNQPTASDLAIKYEILDSSEGYEERPVEA